MNDSQKPAGAWSLRAGDLPAGRAGDHPALEGLADNPIYRRLLQVYRSDRPKRLRLVYGGLFGWLLVPVVYTHMLFPMGWRDAALCAVPVGIAIQLLIGFLFMIGGIEGYESLRVFLPRPVELVLTKLTGRDLAAGIWARTFALYRPARIRVALAVAAITVCAAMWGQHRSGLPLLLQWVCLFDLFLCAAVWRLLRDVDALPLPGAILWTRSIRLRYVRRLAPGRAFVGVLKGIRLEVMFLSVIAMVMLPLVGYWAVGELLNARLASAGVVVRSEHLALAAGLFLAAGWVFGAAWARRARGRRDRNIRRLGRELDRLFRLRARWLLECSAEG